MPLGRFDTAAVRRHPIRNQQPGRRSITPPPPAGVHGVVAFVRGMNRRQKASLASWFVDLLVWRNHAQRLDDAKPACGRPLSGNWKSAREIGARAILPGSQAMGALHCEQNVFMIDPQFEEQPLP
jgi:hypothetical protein